MSRARALRDFLVELGFHTAYLQVGDNEFVMLGTADASTGPTFRFMEGKCLGLQSSDRVNESTDE